jgi:serine/threonine protein kinase
VDIASALVFLHSKGLVHLDVKSLNILLKGNRTEAKLADLGLSKMVPDGQLSLMNTLPGTPAYSAPEVMEAQLQWRLRTVGRRDEFKTEVRTRHPLRMDVCKTDNKAPLPPTLLFIDYVNCWISWRW